MQAWRKVILHFQCQVFSIMTGIKILTILQGLGVAQVAVTERWPKKEEKTPENQLFLVTKFKITIFLHIYFSQAKIL